ncbi:sensor histidine kinase [Bifidobacterium sp. 82T24]|uniref:sensor histidine kinase n=1 Tax=Bifidobacterium pluvialisilvae TaxID=2834436 RepID=UPI001C596CAE|nr:histidine kinase [Bifidobacterium pluvialisilvae]MBW3087834.1 sensor histidine kinase [Bifidobacterium pluvialisilvae]
MHAFPNILARTASAARRLMDRNLIVDVATSLMLTTLLSLVSSSWTLQDGLLFPFSTRLVLAWTWVYALPLAFRRKAPHVSAALFVALALLQLVFGPALVATDCYALILLYSVIVYGRRETAKPFIAVAVGMTLLAAGVITTLLAFGPLSMPGPDRYRRAPYECLTPSGDIALNACDPSIRLDALMMLAMFLAPVIAVTVMAYWQRARTTTLRWMRERNAALEARREEEAHIAALAERARIARDMHDVVAHTLSIIIVQADGGRFAGANDRALARSTMETIRRESVKALADMRRLLGIFADHHDGDDADAKAEDDRPSYAGIDGLIAQTRAASPDLYLERRRIGKPDPDRLDTSAQIIAYRVVQESLTNIRKYAGSNVHAGLEETWTGNGLRLRVVDDGRGATAAADGHKAGYGLIGMRERLASLGGTCTAGPRVGGGFEVAAFIPFDGKTPRKTNVFIPSDTDKNGATRPSTDDDVTTHSDGMTFISGSKQAVIDRMHTIFMHIRNGRKTTDAVGAPESHDFNVIERVSSWTERHYQLMDFLIVAALAMMFLTTSVNGMTPEEEAWRKLSNTAVLLPLIWRRRFPQASAAAFAAVTVLELLTLPWSTLAPLASVYSVYSVTLYGPRTAKRWAIPTIALGSCVFAVNFTASNYLDMTTMAFIAELPTVMNGAAAKATGTLFMLLAYAVASCITLLGAMAWGMWSRSRGANMLVLQAREEALRDEEAKQKLLAANMERDRISANIQADVSDTLLGVMGKADDGLRLLDSDDTDAHMIAAAFEGIASEGRAALKRMRQLLGVLRETGFSDDEEKPRIRLDPASPLDEQLQWKSEGPAHDDAGNGAR